MTAERTPSTQHKSIVDSRMALVLKDGKLVQTSPRGKELRALTPQESLTVFSDILEKMKLAQAGGDTTLPQDLGLRDEGVNREQFSTVLMMSGAAMRVAKDFTPGFDNLSLDEKFQQAGLVVEKMTDIALSFERKRLQIAELDALQEVLSTTKRLWTRGFFEQASTLPTAEKRMIFQTMEKLAGLAMVGVAAQIPDQLFESGIQKVVASSNALAEAGQAKRRAQLETDLKKEQLELARAARAHEAEMKRIERDNQRSAARAQVEDLNRKSLVEAKALEKDKAEDLAKRQRESSLQLNREGWGALVSNIKRIPSDSLNWIADFVFDANTGIIVKGAQAFTSTINHLSENVATTRIIGLGAGGTVGLLSGLGVGSAALSYVEAAAVVSPNVLTATIWVSGVSLGFSGAALGAYLGPNIVRGIRNVYDFGSNATKDIIDAADNWIKDPNRRWNKNKQTSSINTNSVNPQNPPNTPPSGGPGIIP